MPIWDLIRWIPNTSDSFRRPAADGSAKGDQGCLADLDERRGLNNKNADFICIYICMYIYIYVKLKLYTFYGYLLHVNHM